MSGLTVEQLKLRKTGIGASEIGAIVGLNPYKSALDVYCAKTGITDPPEDNSFVEWGRILEQPIAEKYAKDTGARLRNYRKTRAHRNHPWILATPDRMAYMNGDRWLLEIKTAGYFSGRRWGSEGDEIPEEYLVQAAWQMAVCDMGRCDVAALLGGNDYRVFRVDRDKALEARLIELGREFWFDNVIADNPPEPDGSDAAKRALAVIFPNDDGEIIAGGEEAEEWAYKLQQARGIKETAEAAEREASSHLKRLIGDNAGIAGAWGMATWKASKDKTTTDWKAVAQAANAGAELIAQHTDTKPGSRRFLPKFNEGDD